MNTQELLTAIGKRKDWANQSDIAHAFSISQPHVSKILRDAGLRLNHGIITKNSATLTRVRVSPKTPKLDALTSAYNQQKRDLDERGATAKRLMSSPVPLEGIPVFPEITDQWWFHNQRATEAKAALSQAKRAMSHKDTERYAGTFLKLYDHIIAGAAFWPMDHIKVLAAMLDNTAPTWDQIDAFVTDMKQAPRTDWSAKDLTDSKPTAGSSDDALCAKRVSALMAFTHETGKPASAFRLYPEMSGRELSVACGWLAWPVSWGNPPVFAS